MGHAMETLWPWLAVAGAGALHGLNPLAGWGPAAALAVRDSRRRRWWKALGAIAVGHLVSVALTAVVIAAMPVERMAEGRTWLAALAVAMFAVLAMRHAWHRSITSSRSDRPASASKPASGSGSGSGSGSRPAPGAGLGGWGLGLWSFVAATAHGAGMMLLPALAPLCLGTTVGRELTATGSLMLAVSVVAVHAAAMLGTMGVATLVATRVWGASRRRWLQR